MAGIRNYSNTQSLDGYFLPNVRKSEETDDGEDEDEEDEIQMLDVDEMQTVENGGTLARFRPLPEKTVLFQVINSGQEIRICGKLLMTDPWWMASVQLKFFKRGGLRFLAGTPGYRLRDDPGVITLNLVRLFLVQIGADAGHIDIFFNEIQSRVKEVTFQNVLPLLKKFERETSPDNDGVAKSLLGHLQNSEKGIVVFIYLSENLTDFYMWIPQLLPRQFSHFLLDLEHYNVKLRQRLNTALLEEPWVFGFRSVMNYKFGVVGCEATLQAYKTSGMFEKLSPLHEDALCIYDVLKTESRRNGHTFLYENSPTLKSCGGHVVTNYRNAYQFLVDNYVIVREKSRIYLRCLWKAEEEITQGIDKMLRSEPWTFDIDFERPEFHHIAQDPDQKFAAEVISQNPVTVLSGKGGCGKTTVVSCVFKHAENLLRESGTDVAGEEDSDELKFNEKENLLRESGTDVAEEEDSDKLKFNEKENLLRESGTDLADEQDSDKLKFNEKANKITTNGITVLLTAPTGKAANILGRRSRLPSFTLHQVIWSYRAHLKNVKKAKEEGKPVPEWKFSHIVAVVVDESSLVPVSLFNNMFQLLLNNSKLKKLVILGDVNQLPSIDPGNFLSDVFDSLSDVGCSVMLRQNHRSESDLIVKNAELIAKMKLPKFNREKNFFDVIVQEDASEQDFDAAVKKLLKSKEPSIGTDEKSQFVAFKRRDCTRINEICCLHYGNHSIKNSKGKWDFQPGDKVFCTKNGNVTNHFQSEKLVELKRAKEEVGRKESADKTGRENMDLSGMKPYNEISKKSATNESASMQNGGEIEKEEEEEDIQLTLRLCNGEVFFIEDDITTLQADDVQRRFLVLDDRDPDPEHRRVIKVDFHEVMTNCKLRHAWARTIHTYQGSESETVIYVVGQSIIQNWKHVYTAVTRGRKQVFILFPKNQLLTVVGNSAKKRNSSLYDRLEKLILNLKKKGIVLGLSGVPASGAPPVPSGAPNSASSAPPTAPYAAAVALTPPSSSGYGEYTDCEDGQVNFFEDECEYLEDFDDSGVIRYDHATGCMGQLTSQDRPTPGKDSDHKDDISLERNRAKKKQLAYPKTVDSSKISGSFEGTKPFADSITAADCNSLEIQATGIDATNNTVNNNESQNWSDWSENFVDNIFTSDDISAQERKGLIHGNVVKRKEKQQNLGRGDIVLIDHVPVHSINDESSMMNDSELLNAADAMEAQNDKPCIEKVEPFRENSKARVSLLPSFDSPPRKGGVAVGKPMDDKSPPSSHQIICERMMTSPKRSAPPSFSTPANSPSKKPTIIAAYDGMCDHCLSPIKRGIDRITFEKTPLQSPDNSFTRKLSASFHKRWIHSDCNSPTTSMSTKMPTKKM